jgi:hypothetical protein
VFTLVAEAGGGTVTVNFMELAGDNCHDLLNGFNKVQLLLVTPL